MDPGLASAPAWLDSVNGNLGLGSDAGAGQSLAGRRAV